MENMQFLKHRSTLQGQHFELIYNETNRVSTLTE
jgi:hypothetical protein